MAIQPSLQVLRQPEQAETLFHPVRLRLLELLKKPGSAASIAPKAGIPRQQANYHLRELERVGLVQVVEERRRGSATERILQASAAYVVDPGSMGALAADPRQMADRYSLEYLVAVAQRLVREVSSWIAHIGPERHVPTLAIEAEIRFRNAGARAAFAKEAANALAQLVDRYHDEAGNEATRYRVLLATHPIPDENPKENPT